MKKKIIRILPILCLIGIFSSTVLAQTTKLKFEDLPAVTKTILDKKYSKYSINVISKLVEGQGTIYKIELQKKSKLIDLVCDLDGNILNTKKSKVFTFDGTEPVKKVNTDRVRPSDGHNHSH